MSPDIITKLGVAREYILHALKQIPDGKLDKEAVGFDLLRQIIFNHNRFVADLGAYLYFSSEEIRAIAWQVVIETTIYGEATSLLSDGLRAFLPETPPSDTSIPADLYDQQRREFRYCKILPILMFYVTDKITDGFYGEAIDTSESQSHIYKELLIAEEALEDNPFFYHQKLSFLLQISLEFHSDSPSLLEDPKFAHLLRESDLQAYALFVPFIELLKRAQVPEKEIVDVFINIQDAMTNGQRALLLWRKIQLTHSGRTKPVVKVPFSYLEIIDQCLDPYEEIWHTATQEAALASMLLKNTALLAVVDIHDLLSCLEIDQKHSQENLSIRYQKRQKNRSLSSYIEENPTYSSISFIQCLQILEFVVRFGDDGPDIENDLLNNAPNINLSSLRTRENFFALSELQTVLSNLESSPQPNQLIISVIKQLETLLLSDGIHDVLQDRTQLAQYHKHLFSLLRTLVDLVYKDVFESSPMIPAEFRQLGKRIYAVAIGSLLSAQHPDDELQQKLSKAKNTGILGKN